MDMSALFNAIDGTKGVIQIWDTSDPGYNYYYYRWTAASFTSSVLTLTVTYIGVVGSGSSLTNYPAYPVFYIDGAQGAAGAQGAQGAQGAGDQAFVLRRVSLRL